MEIFIFLSSQRLLWGFFGLFFIFIFEKRYMENPIFYSQLLVANSNKYLAPNETFSLLCKFKVSIHFP